MTRILCRRSGQARCVLLLCCIVFVAAFTVRAQEIAPHRYAVRMSAQVQESPPKITLRWPDDGDASSYQVSRRTLDSGWQSLATLGGSATSVEDNNVSVGTKYEYQLVKASARHTGYGYIGAGIRLPITENRGKLVLVVENSLAGPLETELNRLQRDLTGDGWVVIRRNVSMNDSPQSVKGVIKSVYDSDPANVKAVFLFGHVPVPYSGDIFPDGHLNHKGAWPADVYYGEMDGTWTDSIVTSREAERQVNWNVPGDGKFDQGEIPGEVELMVGRVDLHNLTSFANKTPSRSELDLMRQYLNKNHSFRQGQIAVERRGIICDNFTDKGDDPIAGSAWRAFPGFFGADAITEVPWDGFLPATTQNSYLWGYASGGGTYYYSVGVGSSDDFALQDVKVVFAMFMGSYFGDWNNESNFLRAALGSGYILTSSYSGFPHTFYFPMALGEPIGYCIRLSQNNGPGGLYPPWNQGTRQVHIALHGDPSLRMHPVKPPANLNISTEAGTARLNWSASSETGLQGYYVYRATSADGPFARVSASAVTGTSFSDTPPAGNYTYMVRAIKLEQSASGTYLNPSQGIFGNASVSGNAGPQIPEAPTLEATVVSHNRVDLQWSNVADETGYRLERKTGSNWSQITSTGANITSFSDEGVVASTEYSYRVRAFNAAGDSPYSAEARVNMPAAPKPEATVRFVEADMQTKGNWPEKFGGDGFALAAQTGNLPGSIQFGTGGAANHIWQRSSTDERAPVVAPTSSTRIASGWAADPLALELNVSAALTQRIALYFLDWDRLGRVQRVAVIDAATGEELHSREISAFGDGVYLVYEIRGNVRVAVTKSAGANAVMSGIFAGPAVQAPISDGPLTLEVRQVSPGELILGVTGDAGQRFRLEASDDFLTWREVTVGTVETVSTEIAVPIDDSQTRVILRTVNTR